MKLVGANALLAGRHQEERLKPNVQMWLDSMTLLVVKLKSLRHSLDEQR